MMQVAICLVPPQRMGLAPLYGASKIIGTRPWFLGVTWLHRLHDHSTRGGRLPIGCPLWPCVYLAPLSRYSHL